MKSFPKKIKFKYNWRDYQARVLEELEGRMADSKLHIIAAPGSGKTVLGLEVMLRLDKPTLILAPSISLQNQWIERFRELFLQVDMIPDWISDDIKNPKLLTVSTYQGLHASFAKDDDHDPEDEFVGKTIKLFMKVGLKVLIVDEAHHLRKAWWKSLMLLKKSLKEIKVVSLTATPPYDVSFFEWRNYQELCGPIDEEISVPELVNKGDLCHHQDFVYLNTLTVEENRNLDFYNSQVRDFIQNIRQSRGFIDAIKSHPHVLEPKKFVNNILKTPEYYSSIVIFLKNIGEDLPEELIDMLGVSERQIPNLNLNWLEILLEFSLFKDKLLEDLDVIKDLRRQLRKIGAAEHSNVSLINNPQTEKLLRTSLNKLESILKITKFEYSQMNDGLRMVILTDYIRKEFLPSKNDEFKNIDKIGVVPIFEKLRNELDDASKIGILTGSLVVIPIVAKKSLVEISAKYNISRTSIKIIPLSFDKNFASIIFKGSENRKIVQIITELFSIGEIHILVGTKALLGEGWDAPSVNTLILASFVGSFVLSNQMRGRAIRTDPNQPSKVSNIWHLATVDKNKVDPGPDFKMLKRRFSSFVGVNNVKDSIESGFDRLAIPVPPYSESKVDEINTKTYEYASDRVAMKKRWEFILRSGSIHKLVPELKAHRKALPRAFVFQNTVYALVWRSMATGGVYVLNSLAVYLETYFQSGFTALFLTLTFAGYAALAISLPGLFQAIIIFLKHGSISSSMNQIALALSETLLKTKIIKADPNKIKIITEVDNRGRVYCGLSGVGPYEQSIFLECLEEILDQIHNPKYILARHNYFFFINQKDYHSVPMRIGAHKKWALEFEEQWKKYVGPTKLIYTRTAKGRRAILNARKNAMSTKFKNRSERIDSWK